MGKIGKFMKAIGRVIGVAASGLSAKFADFQILILSCAVVFLHLVLLCIGVADQNRLLIILPGIIASLYFSAIVFLALERPSLFRGLVSRLGFTLTGGKWSAEDKKRMRCLWFLAVAPLFFTFWLAMFPTRTTGLLVIISALCLLTLLIIGHWQEIPANFWKAYYHFAKKAFPITIGLVFLVYVPFAGFWNSVGRAIVQKSQQAAVWMSSPSKAEKRAESPKSSVRKKAVAVAPRPMAEQGETPVRVKTANAPTAPTLRKNRPASREDAFSDDALAEAAEAAEKAKAEVLREGEAIRVPNWAR